MKPAIRLGDKEPRFEFWKMVFKDILWKQGLNILLLLLSPILVPLAVMFRKTDKWPSHIHKKEYGSWKFYTTRIPFLKVYVGDVGFGGDGTYPNTIPSWIKVFGMTSIPANIYWALIRNPVGGYDREFKIGCKLTEDSQIYYYGDARVGDDGDGAGRQFIITKTPEDTYRGFYKITLLPDNPKKCKRIRAGYKVKTYYTESYTQPVDATLFSYSTKDYKEPK